MVSIQIDRSGLGRLPFVTNVSQMIFRWLNSQYRNMPPLKSESRKLSGVAQLYLASQDDPALAASTSELFRVSSTRMNSSMLQHGNYGGMADEEKRNYENRIVSFFLVNLPLTGEPLPEISRDRESSTEPLSDAGLHKISFHLPLTDLSPRAGTPSNRADSSASRPQSTNFAFVSSGVHSGNAALK